MDREGKGRSVDRYIKDYCVVDLETTGCNTIRDRIIEVAALKVRNNIVIDKYSSLVNPGCHIPQDASNINHITDEMVESAPSVDTAMRSFLDFVNDDVIMGYNIASFDILFLYDEIKESLGLVFSNNYLDLYNVAKKSIHDTENHKLETISKNFGLDIAGEHRALKDCYLTKECYDKIRELYGEGVFTSQENRRGVYQPRYSDKTKELQDLHVLLERFLEDGSLCDDEVVELREWMNSHTELAGSNEYDRIHNILDRLSDGKESEIDIWKELVHVIQVFVDPIGAFDYTDHEIVLFDKHVCITGDFDYGNRETVYDFLRDNGAIIDNNVKKTTDYLFVGARGSEGWKLGNYGGKIQKATEYNEKGSNIYIIKERDLFSNLSNNRRTNENDSENKMSVNWEDSTNEMLSDLAMEFELPKGSLYLSENKTRDGEISSHSICIWEPRYPMRNVVRTRNATVVNISPKKASDDLELTILKKQEYALHSFLPSDAELLNQSKTDIENNRIRIKINKHSLNLIEYLRMNTCFCIKNYKSNASAFGCCCLFEKCSEAGKCVHINKLYSKACMYRNNLENGRVFYGMNKKKDKESNMEDNATIRLFSGGKELDDEEKAMRREIGLPVTKQLVYYPDKHAADSVTNVTHYRIEKTYNTTEKWYTIEITTENGTKVKINSLFLVEMQKPSFLEDIAKTPE